MKKEDLKEYGKVEVCQEINGMFHVKITTGFNNNANKTFELMKKINDSVGDKYSIIERCITDENLFDYIIKPKK